MIGWHALKKQLQPACRRSQQPAGRQSRAEEPPAAAAAAAASQQPGRPRPSARGSFALGVSSSASAGSHCLRAITAASSAHSGGLSLRPLEMSVDYRTVARSPMLFVPQAVERPATAPPPTGNRPPPASSQHQQQQQQQQGGVQTDAKRALLTTSMSFEMPVHSAARARRAQSAMSRRLSGGQSAVDRRSHNHHRPPQQRPHPTAFADRPASAPGRSEPNLGGNSSSLGGGAVGRPQRHRPTSAMPAPGRAGGLAHRRRRQQARATRSVMLGGVGGRGEQLWMGAEEQGGHGWGGVEGDHHPEEVASEIFAKLELLDGATSAKDPARRLQLCRETFELLIRRDRTHGAVLGRCAAPDRLAPQPPSAA
jgi:hypothetical protein